MLWGHLILCLFAQKFGSDLTYKITFIFVLVFTELLPFSLICYNMIRRLKLYNRARKAFA